MRITMPGDLLRLLLVPVVVAIATAGNAGARAGGLVVVAPDVEIVRGDGPLPSARISERVARDWPGAVAAAFRLSGAPPVWTPPADPRAEPALAQALALQEAVAGALVPARGDPLPPQPHLALGRDAGRALGDALPGRHALFLRVRAGNGNGHAVATLVSLPGGELVAHRVLRRLPGDPADPAFASRLAQRLLRGFPALPAGPAGPPPGGAATGPLPPDDVDADLDRAVARLERQLLAHPAREDDPELLDRLHAIACRLAPTQCAGLRLHVLREPGFNAWAVPDGLLVLRTGTLLRCRDEAEVAFVLAHELAHDRHGDARDRWRRGQTGPEGLEGSPAAERRADAEAQAMLAVAGYPPIAAARLWSRLLAETGDVRPAPAARTHPPLHERVADLHARAAIPGGGEGDDGGARWQRLLADRHARWLQAELAATPADRAGALLAALATAPADDGIRAREDAARRAYAGDAAALAAIDRRETFHDAGTPPSAVSAPRATGTTRALGLMIPAGPGWARQRGAGVELWTRHGLPLDRLLLMTGLAPGQPLLRDVVAGAPPWAPGRGEAGLRLDLAASLHAAGWRDIAVGPSAPWPAGGGAAWRAEVSLAASSGLRYRGLVAAAPRGDRLALVIWLAPAVHYHPREAAATSALVDGLRFGR